MPYENGDTIAQRILAAINPRQLPPLALWDELTVLTKDVVMQRIQNSVTERFYLLYIHYLGKKESYRVFLADRESVIRFIQETFDEEWDEGMDMMISDMYFQNVIMGNHDGVLVGREE